MKYKASLNWVFISFALADFPGFVCLVLYYHKFYGLSGFKINFKVWKNLIINSYPLVLSSVFTTIHFKVDILLVKRLLEKEQVAFYRNAVVIPELLTFIPIAFMVPFFPVLSKKFTLDKKAFLDTFRAGAKYLFFIVAPIVLYIYFYMEDIILMIFKEKYIPAIGAATIVIFSEIFVYASSIFNNALVASNKQNYWLLFSGLSCITNIILNLFLIPRYGIEGAAMATVISYGLFLVWSLALKSTRELSIILMSNMPKPVISVLIMFLFITVFKQNLWISFLPAAGIYIGSFIIMKGFKKKDLLFLKELLPSKYSINYFKDDV